MDRSCCGVIQITTLTKATKVSQNSAVTEERFESPPPATAALLLLLLLVLLLLILLLLLNGPFIL